MLDSLLDGVLGWAYSNGIISLGTPRAQFDKVREEISELEEELKVDKFGEANPDNLDRVSMELGDVVITLIVLADQLNLDFTKCLDIALKKIKKRKGSMINGVFVREDCSDGK